MPEGYRPGDWVGGDEVIRRERINQESFLLLIINFILFYHKF